MSRTLLMLTALAVLPCCSMPTFDATARYGTLEPTGDFGITSGGPSSSVDVEDAGFEEDESVPGFVLDMKWGMPHVTVSALTSRFSGTGTLDSTLSQGGVTIPAGASVKSEMDLDIYSGIVTFDILPTKLELGIGAGITAFDFSAKVTERSTGESLTTDETLAIPVLAARAGMEFGDFELSGLVSGSSLEISDVDITYYDLDVSARWRFLGGKSRVRGSLLIGWHQFATDFDYEDGRDEVEGDLTFKGPYLGLQFTL